MPSYTDLEGYRGSPYVNVAAVKEGKLDRKQIISLVAVEPVGKDQKQKLVAYLQDNEDYQLVLNKTNADILFESTGTDNYEEWKDIPIELNVVKVNTPDGPKDGVQISVIKGK